MKRRKFITHAALGGIALFFAPLHKFSREKRQVIQLPQAETHGRHGVFNLTAATGVKRSNGITNLRFQRLFKDGCAPSDQDLCVVSFKHNHNDNVVSFTFSELTDGGYTFHTVDGIPCLLV